VRANINTPGPAGPLQGTLLSPRNQNGRVVLIVPGSGPTDRNGNGPKGLRASTYRLLAEGASEAWHLFGANRQMGMYSRGSAMPDADDVTLDDYAADVNSWMRTIR
jgi:hypothetical protein